MGINKAKEEKLNPPPGSFLDVLLTFHNSAFN